MKDAFEIRVDNMLNEIGHWTKYDAKKPTHFIIDPKSWPRYAQMDPSTGRGRKKKKTNRIAGKL